MTRSPVLRPQTLATALGDYQVMSFDCYGTLIDWEAGIWTALQPLLTANGATPDRSEVLTRFGELETAEEVAHPGSLYPRILAAVHRSLASELAMETSDQLDQAFGATIAAWPAFPDSADALRRLGRRYRLVILSNVDRAGFAASAEHLGVGFDAVYTAEDIGSYKPDPANFDYLLEHVENDLGLGAESLIHVAQSLFHDHAPAKACGLDTVWIDRQRLSQGGSWGATKRVETRPEPDWSFFTLGELADAVESL